MSLVITRLRAMLRNSLDGVGALDEILDGRAETNMMQFFNNSAVMFEPTTTTKKTKQREQRHRSRFGRQTAPHPEDAVAKRSPKENTSPNARL
jgi:hypothetical protein